MDDTEDGLAGVARAHGFGVDAVACLHRALVAGGGMAQFSHPELGGLGQWAGGMVMIGEMGNPALRRRVGALCAALSARQPAAPARRERPGPPEPGAADAPRPAWTRPQVEEGPASAVVAPAGDAPALIERLAGLRAAGVLTEAEFAGKKAELLARL